MAVKLSAKGTVTPVLADRVALIDDVGGADNVRLSSFTAVRDLLEANFTENVIGNLTADASPDGAADYVMVRDATGPSLKKVLLDNLPGGGTPGGSDTQVQFNDGGSFGGDAGFTFDDTNKTLTLGGGTITTSSKPVLDLSQTWNDSGVTFTGIKLDVTNTAANSGSNLIELLEGGTGRFSVRTDGQVLSGLTGVHDPTYSFVGDEDTGWGYRTADELAAVTAGSARLRIQNVDIISLVKNFSLRNLTGALNFNTSTSVTPQVSLAIDGDHTLGQRNGTNAQTSNLYATYSSTTDYHRSAWATAKQTASAVSGASVTLSGIIPDGAVLVGCTSKVTTALGTGNGTTGYQVGDGSDVDRWGEATAVTLGTVTQNSDWTATTIQAFTSAQDVVLTAVGGNFDGTGAIEVTVHYLRGEAD